MISGEMRSVSLKSGSCASKTATPAKAAISSSPHQKPRVGREIAFVIMYKVYKSCGVPLQSYKCVKQRDDRYHSKDKSKDAVEDAQIALTH